jgi:hypothetical protein
VARKPDGDQCNYVQTNGNPGNCPEPPGNSKILKSFWFSENGRDIKGRKIASQAYDEGSIPFTRSNVFNRYPPGPGCARNRDLD